jgi:hypothetical protein
MGQQPSAAQEWRWAVKRFLPRRRMVLGGIVLIVVLTGLYLARQFEARKSFELLQKTMADLDREIDQNLPVGSDQSEIIKFLDSHGIEHSPIVAGFIENGPAFTIDAQTRKRNGTLINACSIHIEFSFNAEQRLTSYSDKYDCYGP